MKIRITHHVCDLERRALNYRLGRPGLAPRADIITDLTGLLDADLMVIVNDFENDHPEEAEALRARSHV